MSFQGNYIARGYDVINGFLGNNSGRSHCHRPLPPWIAASAHVARLHNLAGFVAKPPSNHAEHCIPGLYRR